MSTTTQTITMKPDKQCKGSVRYATDDPNAAVASVYLSRGFDNPMPAQITITISSGETK